MIPNLDLSQVIPAVVKSIIDRRVHTATICKVIAYNQEDTSVDVIPIVNNTSYKTPIEYKKIGSVPVMFPASGSAGLTFPIEKGDIGTLVFAERSIDEAYEKGDRATPVDPRRFSLSDALFIPGLKTTSQSYQDAVEVTNGNVKVVLRDGKIAIGVNGTELLDLLSKTLEALNTTTVVTSLGPQPLTNAVTFGLLKVELDSIKGTL